jgi:hypothetical protein
MTEISPLVKVARDLREIETLYEGLLVQAVHKANDRLMPGGEAMVALAPVGSPYEWGENVAAEEFYHLSICNRLDHSRCHYAESEDDEGEPPLQTLLFWSEQWRAEAGYSLDRRPTISTEANFIRGSLDWAWDNELHWDEFAKDVRRARVRLENLLYAGKRADRTRVRCDADDCDFKPLLIVAYADTEDADHFKCPSCKRRYSPDEFQRAYARMLRSEGAERYVPLVDALATLKAQGRPERTIRKWLADEATETVSAWCDLETRKTWVWWPDLWRLHLSTPTRKRSAA